MQSPILIFLLFAACAANPTIAWMQPSADFAKRNEEALLMLRDGRTEEALRVLSLYVDDVLESDTLSSTAKSRFVYNFGIALQKTGHLSKSVDAFLKSRELDPGFKEPVEAILALSYVDRASRPQAMISMAELLITQKDLKTARRLLEQLLSDPSINDVIDYDAVLNLMALYLTAIYPGEFADEWLTLLSTKASRSTPKGEMLQQVYFYDFPVIFEKSRGRHFSKDWQKSTRERTTFSGLLKALGDRLMIDGSPADALPRYALAWSSADNIDAAIDIAALLKNYSSYLDPQGEILTDFVHHLPQGTGVTQEISFASLFRLRSVVAEIFEGRRQWGDEKQQMSAIFYLSGAIQAAERLTSDNSSGLLAAVAGLRARLGRAYKATGRRIDAYESYLLATKIYLASGRPEAAEATLLQATKLAPRKSDQPSESLELLNREVLSAQATHAAKSGISDSRITEWILAKLTADPDISPGTLLVQVISGNVSISGKIDSGKISDIDQLVRSTIGVNRYTASLERTTSKPLITSVFPNPVAGSNRPQPFVISGNNFERGANIILRDLTQGQEFSRRVPSEFTSKRVVLNPNFTTDRHAWSVELINPNGESTGQFNFQVLGADVPGSVLGRPVYSASPWTRGPVTALEPSLQEQLRRLHTVPGWPCTRLREGPDLDAPTSAVGPTPGIRRVSPNPVTGLPWPQAFTVHGHDFAFGANIIIRDLDTGEEFGRRCPSFYSSTKIVIDPIFTIDPHSWSIEIVNPDGKSTGQYRFEVVKP